MVERGQKNIKAGIDLPSLCNMVPIITLGYNVYIYCIKCSKKAGRWVNKNSGA